MGALPDISRVTTLLEDVARDLVMPRFRSLLAHEIESKAQPGDPDDVVTIVDRQVEQHLTTTLRAMLPGVPVVGEEAVHEHPDLLRHVTREDPCWLLDPIDGTKNFARGGEGFGIMLAYVERGRTRAAWVVLPARGDTCVAEEGSGVTVNGERPRPDRVVQADRRPRGSLHLRYMPRAVADAVSRGAGSHFEVMPDTGCAAVEYTDLLTGIRDFGVYYRLMPWDHAPGALILTEGGGRVEHLDGQPYTPRSGDQVTVVASSAEMAVQVRSWFGNAPEDGGE